MDFLVSLFVLVAAWVILGGSPVSAEYLSLLFFGRRL